MPSERSQIRAHHFLVAVQAALLDRADQELAVDRASDFKHAERYSGTVILGYAQTALHAVHHIPQEMPISDAVRDLLTHMWDDTRCPVWYARDLSPMRTCDPLPKSEQFIWLVQMTSVAAFRYRRAVSDISDERELSSMSLSRLIAHACEVSSKIPKQLGFEEAADAFCDAAGLFGNDRKRMPKWAMITDAGESDRR